MAPMGTRVGTPCCPSCMGGYDTGSPLSALPSDINTCYEAISCIQGTVELLRSCLACLLDRSLSELCPL